MKYALNLAEDGRVLSATFERFAADGNAVVDTLPDGDITEYRYVNGEYVHDPLPEPDPVPEKPSQLDRVEAQAVYTAMMTDTLLESEV